MERTETPSTSKQTQKKKTDDVQKKESYSPTKYFSNMAHFETERILKLAEAETRLEFYKNFKTAREEILRDDCTINQVHLRQLEEYQIDQTAKRREEIRAIEKDMRDYDERAQKSWRKN